jgi:predicted O-methyltransferase YrrM
MRTQKAKSRSFDPRHLLPMASELAGLCVGSLYNRRRRQELVWVGRAVRNAHFQAEDRFRSMKLPEIVARLSNEEQGPVRMPPVDRLVGNTIGDVKPYWLIGVLAAAKRPKTVFEIGTYLGASALAFALNTDPDCQIITVDLPDETATDTLSDGDKALVEKAMSNVGAAFRNHPLASRIRQVRADSASMNINDYLNGRLVDFFFIDGGHSHECVSRDTATAFSCLSSDGLVMWDDYSWIFPDVCDALQQLARAKPLVRIEGTQYVLCHQSLG